MSELVLLVKTTIVLAAALAAVAAGRHAAAAVRALILTAAFAIVLGMPFAQWLMPARVLEVGLPVIQSTPVASARQVADAVSSAAAIDTTRGPAAVATAPVRMTIGAIVRIVWLAGVVVVALRLVFAFGRLRRLRRTGTAWHDEDAAAVVRQATTRRVSVFLHADLAAPMTCGFARPAIALPADAPRWTTRDLRRALIHELEHVRRGDWLVQVAARLACGVYWFHPLVWIAERRLTLENDASPSRWNTRATTPWCVRARGRHTPSSF
jgi:beta-lactamase regulating signal transducer with metallopeptidase domain